MCHFCSPLNSFSQQSDDPGRGRPGRSHSVDLSAAVDQLLEEFASFPKHQQEMKLKSTLPGSEVELQVRHSSKGRETEQNLPERVRHLDFMHKVITRAKPETSTCKGGC